jgi:tripartite-type tricarboxylate transporter receptor subunit TctC
MKHTVPGLIMACALALAACAPATPAAPTTAASKPAAAQPTEAPKPAPSTGSGQALSKAEGPVATAAQAKPTQAPAAKPAEAKPAGSPAAQPAEAKPAASPAAKAAYDEKAVADFFRGKTVKIVVGFSAGGGFDINSRMIAKYLPKYLPGSPNVIVENMTGGASMLALNHVVNVAPKDGTAIASAIGTLALRQLFGAEGVQFDMAKLHYLGTPNRAAIVGVAHQRTGITTLDQLIGPNAKELAIGAEVPGASVTDGPILVREVLGARLKVVMGYEGTSKIKLAIDSGEVDGYFNAWDSVLSLQGDQVRSKELVPFIQLTADKLKDLPTVPGLNEVAKTQEQAQMLRFGVDSPNRFLRPYMLAPEVPAERVAALQDAFMKTMQDKDFLADAQKARLDVEPLSGAEVRRLVTEFMAMPADIKERLRKVMQPS